MTNATRISELLFGGWQFGVIGTARAGLPVNVTISRSASDLPDQLNENQRANRVPSISISPSNRTPQNWINLAAFSAPAVGVHGDAGRNVASAPGLWQVDSSLQKRFSMTERIGISFRAGAFNLFNVAPYGTPAVFGGSHQRNFVIQQLSWRAIFKAKSLHGSSSSSEKSSRGPTERF